MKTTPSWGRGTYVFFLALFCLFLTDRNKIFAQEDTICGYDFLQQLPEAVVYTVPQGTYNGSIDPADLENFDPVVFNIYFWQVNDPNGGFDVPLIEHTVLTAVANLNIAFNPYNIFFKYRGFDEFDSEPDQPHYYQNPDTRQCTTLAEIDPKGYSDLHNCEMAKFLSYAKNIGKWKADALNIYVVNSSPSWLGAAFQFKPECYLVAEYLTTAVLTHEVGHVFSLLHTFNGFDYSNYHCEHVTRDQTLVCDPEYPEMPCFNALTNGDVVLDTAAAPKFTIDYDDIFNCSYVGNGVDCQGTPYFILDADVRNYMAYTVVEDGCMDNFTVGQAIRMQESIDWDPSGIFAAVETPIASLYEPYKGEYYMAGPDPDPHTLPRFQPGFDYVFQSCNCANQDNYDCVNGPCEFEENNFQSSFTILAAHTKEETDYNSIMHPNHSSIYIGQLAEYGKRRCYDNWNRTASEGSLIQFNDGVFNTNFTITPQDSTAINSPHFIPDLAPGLYNVQKIYNDGSSQETVILKENNE